MTAQISQKQWNLDLNAITTWPPSHLFKSTPNLKLGQYSTKFHYIKALKSIFDPFAPTCANFDLCQVDSFEKTQLFIYSTFVVKFGHLDPFWLDWV
jgi:hypothetical protein